MLCIDLHAVYLSAVSLHAVHLHDAFMLCVSMLHSFMRQSLSASKEAAVGVSSF